MTKQEIAALTCRILALYIGVNAVVSSVRASYPFLYQQFINMSHGITPDLYYGNTTSIYISAVLSLIVPISLAAALWIKANWLSQYMIRNGKEHHSEIKINSADIQTIAFSSIGLFLLVESFPQLIVVLFALLFLPTMHTSPNVLSFTTFVLLYPLLGFITGGLLLFKASTLVRFLKR